MTFLDFLPIVAVCLLWGERMREIATKRDTVPGHCPETWTFRVFMLCGILMFAGGIAEYLLTGRGPVWPLFFVGLLMAFMSFSLRRQAIRALGKFWSLHPEIREGHEFVRSGPFRRMRHPVYLSMILELLSGASILAVPITAAVVSVLFIPTLIQRIRVEEATLIDKFGDEYAEYRRNVPAIFPRLRLK